LSWLVQVTVAPSGTVNVLGKKLKLSMRILAVLSLTGTDAFVWASLPRILVRVASATNMTNASVPVFKCLRNGVRTVTHLVVGLR